MLDKSVSISDTASRRFDSGDGGGGGGDHNGSYTGVVGDGGCLSGCGEGMWSGDNNLSSMGVSDTVFGTAATIAAVSFTVRGDGSVAVCISDSIGKLGIKSFTGEYFMFCGVSSSVKNTKT